MSKVEETVKTLLVIAGPTGAGKTALSIATALRLNTEIVSADSRQLYKEMDIGTAKPTDKERAAVPHHLIDCYSVSEAVTASEFEREALAILEKLFKKHHVVLLTGGSGLFIDAVCRGLDPVPDVPDGVRKELNRLYSKEGLAPLLKELEEKDPAYFKEVDKKNPRRLIRGLEVLRATGRPFSSFRKKGAANRPFRIVKHALTYPREKLYRKLNDRCDQMLSGGLPEEVRKLYPYRHYSALQSVGYQEFFPCIEGTTSWEEAGERFKKNSRNYAKRQLTWFRKDNTIRWHNAEAGVNVIADKIISELKEGDASP